MWRKQRRAFVRNFPKLRVELQLISAFLWNWYHRYEMATPRSKDESGLAVVSIFLQVCTATQDSPAGDGGALGAFRLGTG
jgi:hypothetical protein